MNAYLLLHVPLQSLYCVHIAHSRLPLGGSFLGYSCLELVMRRRCLPPLVPSASHAHALIIGKKRKMESEIIIATCLW